MIANPVNIMIVSTIKMCTENALVVPQPTGPVTFAMDSWSHQVNYSLIITMVDVMLILPG